MQPESSTLIWDAGRAAGRRFEFVSAQPCGDTASASCWSPSAGGRGQIDDALVWEVASTRVPAAKESV